MRGSLVFPGNISGVNWGSAAYDPVRHVMVANTNRVIAWSKLIPRAQFESETNAQQDNRIFGEFGRQLGAPYGLYLLFSPSKLPCNAPPWGTTEAVDVHSGKRLWDVPLGTLIAGQQTGAINLGGPIAVAAGKRTSDADDLRPAWSTISRHRCRRSRQARHHAGRFPVGIRVARESQPG
jgi:quinoprotein glucose dehydrogenase